MITSFCTRAAASGPRGATAAGIRRLPMVANFILRLTLAWPWWLAARRLGGLARGSPRLGTCRRRVRVIGGGIVLCAIAMPGCSRHPASHQASAAASRPARAGARVAAVAAPVRPRARLAVFGMVVGPGSGPGSGYRVAVLLPGGHHHSPDPSALTNVDGMFALNGELRPGKYTFEITRGRLFLVRPPSGIWPLLEYKFEASKRDATVRVPAVITPSASWFTVVRLKLPGAAAGHRERAIKERGVPIFGQLTKPDGAIPLVGASVGVYRVGGRAMPEFVTAAIPNRLGLFVFRKGRLDPGRYWMSTIVFSGRPKRLNPVGLSALDVAPTPQRDIVLRLREDAGTVEGRVVDSKGHLVRRAEVTLEGRKRLQAFRNYEAETNAEGHYVIKHVWKGTYTASVSFGANATFPVVVKVGNQPVHKDFRLPRWFGG